MEAGAGNLELESRAGPGAEGELEPRLVLEPRVGNWPWRRGLVLESEYGAGAGDWNRFWSWRLGTGAGAEAGPGAEGWSWRRGWSRSRSMELGPRPVLEPGLGSGPGAEGWELVLKPRVGNWSWGRVWELEPATGAKAGNWSWGQRLVL